MGFEPINFDSNTLITPAKLRHIENQYEQGIEDADDDVWINTDHSLRVEVVSSLPTSPVIGRIVFDTSDNKLKVWSGNEWSEQE